MLWERAAGGMREIVPRPTGGYANSPAFASDADTVSALRDGYELAVSQTVWGEPPSFDEAVEAARSLDG